MKKNVRSLSITLIQLFVTKTIDVVYAVIQCNLYVILYIINFFYCSVNKEHASQFQLSSETLVTAS